MENKTKSTNTKRRKNSNRYATRNRVGTSFGEPVHIGFYLNHVLDGEGKTDREKIVELFNTEYYG
jgi:DNA polymerase III sliding clamp (beta) subunit (PCNA family)